MKVIILLLAMAFMSCNNSSSQKKLYEDSAAMMVDSFTKYKAPALPLSDSEEIVRKNRFFLYHTMYEHYKKKAEELK